MQLNHYNTNFKKHKFPIILVCDNVSYAPNIGGLFRMADAFNIKQLILCGSHVPMGRQMTKTARATEKIVDFQIQKSALPVVKHLKSEGYQIISLEISSTSKPLHDFKFLKAKPIVLVVGDENFGVSEAILELSDAMVHINMYGQNSSMNVVQATNITLYEITKQFF